MPPDVDTFIRWQTDEIARAVRDNGVKVCVFAVNGTRRWFRLEYPDQSSDVTSYLNAMWDVNIRLSRLFFEHGINTVILPVFGPELLSRKGYEDIAWRGLYGLATDPKLCDFYSTEDVRVHFYGNYRQTFQKAPWSKLIEPFDNLVNQTAHHKKHRLFLGACAQDATEAIAKYSIDYYKKSGNLPTRRDLVELYYGEYVEPADIFIGFDSFCVFDMPLLDVGETDLYFTVCPSPYFSSTQLREILHDHIYQRGAISDGESESLGYPILESMKTFYNINMGKTQGVGFVKDGIWYPSSQVEIPPIMQS